MVQKVVPIVQVVVFNCFCFSQWPPCVTSHRDCDLLHKVIPRGIVICYTKSVGTPHGGEGGMPPSGEG